MCLQKCLNVIRFASRPLCDVFTTPPPTILDSIVTLPVTLPSRRRVRKRYEGSDSITDHIRTFLKTHLENKFFEPVIFPLYARCVFVNRLAATADF